MQVPQIGVIGRVLLLVCVLVVVLTQGGCRATEPLAPHEDRNREKRTAITRLYVVDDSLLSRGEVIMLQGLQGIIIQAPHANQNLWIDIPDGYKVWLADLEFKYGVTLDYTYQDDPWGLVGHFKSYLDGVVVYDLGQQSVNVATTLAGLLRMLPVDASMLGLAEDLSLDIMDVRGKDEKWCFEHYWEATNHGLVVLQEVSKYALRDYAAAVKAFTFYDHDSDFTRIVFAAVGGGGMVLGWGGVGFEDERHAVSLISEHNLVLIPADHARNMSVLAAFDHEVVGIDRTTVRTEAGVHYVTFVMSDGDNVQWLLNDFATDARWYGSPLRGSFPMGWTVSPSLSNLAPTVMQRLYDSATMADAFICGVSGRGYYYPSEFPALGDEALRLKGALADAGLQALMILDTDYHAFSREYLEPFATLDCVIGGFWAWYDNYSGRNGEIIFVDDKPFVSIKHDLWLKDEFRQTKEAVIADIAGKINSDEGYSAISVHPWTMSVADVEEVITRLDQHVRVVDPIEFLSLLGAEGNR